MSAQKADEGGVQTASFLKKQRVDISFKDVTFEASTIKFWRRPIIRRKEILHGLSGEFPSGQVTAIMGPSGAGKSTLLNILAGYTLKGARGSVRVNKWERNKNNLDSFKRISCYIQQDDHLRGELTVQEAMNIATELKHGSNLSSKQKQAQIMDLLDLMGLRQCTDTKTRDLSGGQKKRLSIAFELITNPPVIFLDEPTTGLDSLSCHQSMEILKMLANQGRTIICTIHQPSALILEMIDRVYAVADGYCIYEGPTRGLVPFLSAKGFKCPVYHNPADFLLEVASGDYGPALGKLINLAKCRVNGRNDEKDSDSPLTDTSPPQIKVSSKEDNPSLQHMTKPQLPCKSELSNLLPKAFATQLYYLYCRNLLLCQKRCRFRVTAFFSHLLPAVLIGLLFFRTGNDASMVRENVCFVFGVLIFLTYIGKMTVALTIPEELHVLRVEHFNRWYSLLPYYLSMIIIEIPMQVFNCLIGLTILYCLSNQPLEPFRYSYFVIFTTITTLVAQAIGFFLGVAVPVKIAVFVGPISAATFSVLGFNVRYSDAPLIFKGLTLLSYFRSAFHSILTVLYGFDRSVLQCSEIYCHFKTPKKILVEMDMENINIYSNLFYLSAVCIFMHFLTFAVLYVKLNNR